MVFFPSYKFMEDVLEVYENEFSAEWVRCISQTSGMNEREKEEFLEEFSASEGTLVGFCVMGGIFSEGLVFLRLEQKGRSSGSIMIKRV